MFNTKMKPRLEQRNKERPKTETQRSETNIGTDSFWNTGGGGGAQRESRGLVLY